MHYKIAWLTPARLGDTIFHTPTIHYFKNHFPNTEIDIIAPNSISANVFLNNPSINKIISSPTEKQLRSLQYSYDLVISDPRVFLSCARYLETTTVRLSTHHLTTMHASKLWINEIRTLFMFDKEYTNEDCKYRIYSSDENRTAVEKRLQQITKVKNKKRFIGLHPGCYPTAHSHYKIWRKFRRYTRIVPIDKLIELCKLIELNHPDVEVILTGCRTENSMINRIAGRTSNTTSFANQTSVQELYALMDHLECYIAPDTGTIHIAFASDVKVVGLYLPHLIDQTGPLPGRNREILLTEDNISEISVEKIYSAVEDILNPVRLNKVGVSCEK